METFAYDVVVIGGGVIGCAVARELSRFELRTALLEKSVDLCAGQSKANTGIIHGGHDAKPGSRKAYYNVLGNDLMDMVCSELDVPYQWNTSLVVSFSEEEDAKIYELYDRGQENGVHRLHIINHDEIMRREPNINPEARIALLVQSGGIVCPYELTFAFAENAAMNGVEFYRSAEVQEITRESSGEWMLRTPAGMFRARAVVNCAGIYADGLNNQVSAQHFHIQPRRGEYYLVDKKYAGSFHASIFQVPSEMGKGILVSPTVDGTLLLGPTAEDIDDKEDKRTTAFGLEKALNGARRTWPNLPNRAFISNFSGLRAHADTGDFIIGEAPDAPLFFNAAGIESPGLTASPAIGYEVAEMVAGALKAKPKADFNPIRRGIPKFREVSNEERARLIEENKDYAKIVCRCEMVSEAEIREAIRRPVGARTVDGIKLRTRAGMGRCQSGFCTPRVLEILAEELGITPEEVRKTDGNSRYVYGSIFEPLKQEGGKQ